MFASIKSVVNFLTGSKRAKANRVITEVLERRELSRAEYANAALEPGEVVYTIASPLKQFQPADQIATVILKADKNVDLGTMVLYLYKSEKRVKRVFKLAEPQLKELLRCKKDRYYLTDLTWDENDCSLSLAKQKSCADLERLIRLHATKPAQHQQPKASTHKSNAPSPYGEVVAQSVAVESKPVAVAKAADPKPVETDLRDAVQRSAKGAAQVGVVVEMGTVDRNGSNGAYKAFCLKLDVDGVHRPNYGVELEREVRERGVKAGDTVRLIAMGREVLPNGAHKNLYRIEILKKG